MSQLADIYAALAAISVTAAGKTPPVTLPDAIPASLPTALLPCRLLQPLGTPLNAQSSGALALGGGQVQRWRLTDLLVWAATGQGRGPADHSGTLVAYCAAYASAVAVGRALDTPASRATVVDVQFEPGLFEVPKASGSRYYGVACTVTVEEIV